MSCIYRRPFCAENPPAQKLPDFRGFLCKAAEATQAGEHAHRAEQDLRAAIVEAFAETGQKQLGNGMSVQVRTKLKYHEGTALDWARQNAPVCLIESLDKKAFEAIAKTRHLPFVSIVETPVAVIGKGE